MSCHCRKWNQISADNPARCAFAMLISLPPHLSNISRSIYSVGSLPSPGVHKSRATGRPITKFCTLEHYVFDPAVSNCFVSPSCIWRKPFSSRIRCLVFPSRSYTTDWEFLRLKRLHTQNFSSYVIFSGFGGLGVACWPLVPKYAGWNPAEVVGFLGRKKSSARLPSEGK